MFPMVTMSIGLSVINILSRFFCDGTSGNTVYKKRERKIVVTTRIDAQEIVFKSFRPRPSVKF